MSQACAFDEDCPSGETCTTPSPRVVDNGDGTVTDRQTCLVWEKKDGADGTPGFGTPNLANPHDVDNRYQWSSTGTAMDGGAFMDFVVKLNTAGFAGHTDWRLPTSAGCCGFPTGQPAELESIVDATGCPTGSPCINAIVGPTAASFYWSSSTGAGPLFAWSVDFSFGVVSSDSKDGLLFVRAVRGGAFISCDDGNACTTDTCDPATGCVYTPVTCGPGASCVAGECQAYPPTCMDAITNGGETDIDCGGPDCPACGLGKHCNAVSDCTGGATCVAGTCSVVDCRLNCGGCGVACPVAGDGWSFNDAGPGCKCIFGTCSCCSFGGDSTRELKPHVVTFVVAGRTLSFAFAPIFNGCITGAEEYMVNWISVPGHDNFGATLTPEGGALALLGLDDGTDQLVYEDTFEVYSPRTFTISFPNGDHYVVDGTTGLLIP